MQTPERRWPKKYAKKWNNKPPTLRRCCVMRSVDRPWDQVSTIRQNFEESRNELKNTKTHTQTNFPRKWKPMGHDSHERMGKKNKTDHHQIFLILERDYNFMFVCASASSKRNTLLWLTVDGVEFTSNFVNVISIIVCLAHPKTE